MKAILAAVLLLCLSMTLSGCDLLGGTGNEFLISRTVKYDHCYRIGNASLDNSRSGGPLIKGQEERPVYDNIVAELMDLTPDKLTESYKKDLTERLDLYNFDYRWNDDNSLTVISEGEEMIFGKTTDWPTSPDCVKRLPVPAGVPVREVETKNGSAVIKVAMTLDEAKAYTEQLKAAGFTNSARETTMVGYTYRGTDDAGYTASVTYTSLFQQIEISDPDPEDDSDWYPDISVELPTYGLIEYLPAIPSGTIESFEDAPDSLNISMSGVSASEGGAFIDKCKERFHAYVLTDTESESMRMYVAADDQDILCSIVFFGEILTIAISG